MCKKGIELTNPTFSTKYFTHGFGEALSTFTQTEQRRLLALSPTFFKKWCFSAFFEDTVLSPVNILNSYFDKRKNEVAYFSYKVNPLGRGNNKYTYQISIDSVDRHSFIKNLFALTEYCFPVATFEEGGVFPLIIPKALSEKLTSTDGFYFEYLLLMAQRFNLLTAMPSINTCKFQKNEEQCNVFFTQTNTQILTLLTDEVFEIFNQKFADMLQIPYQVVNSSIMRSFLKDSITTDDIYDKVYSALGFDFDKMLKMAEIPVLSNENEMLMSSAYFMGTVLDKWFFSPLGDYLKLITPLYSVPYDFMNELDYVRPILLTGCDVSADVFSPCNYFSLTPIGEEILGWENSNPRFQNISQDFSQHKIQLFLSSIFDTNGINITDCIVQNNIREIYTIKVKYADAPQLWKTIQVPLDYPISKLYNLIATYFGFNKSDNYIFSIISNNKATQSFSQIDKTSRFRLNELLHNNNLLLSDGFNNFPDLELSLVSVSSGKDICNYPRLLRQSRAITLEELNDNI
ncbi:MAG: hypothetical protein VB018_12035 [Lachnospiraceae bacterium]|nr:hypothetical protein [Lachnospiraceae bacterium]